MSPQEFLRRLRLGSAIALSLAGAWSVAITGPHEAKATVGPPTRTLAAVATSPDSPPETTGPSTNRGAGDLVERQVPAELPPLPAAKLQLPSDAILVPATPMEPGDRAAQTPPTLATPEVALPLVAPDIAAPVEATAVPKPDMTPSVATNTAAPEAASVSPSSSAGNAGADVPAPQAAEVSTPATQGPPADAHGMPAGQHAATPAQAPPEAQASSPQPQTTALQGEPSATPPTDTASAGAAPVAPGPETTRSDPAQASCTPAQRRGAPSVASGERYELGQGDRIKITFYERADLNSEIRIREDGHIAIPLVGRIRVAGLDTTELELAISEAFQIATGRVAFVGVEIVERRPFYVVGYVNRAGVYPYTPGMTVLHAVAISGGIFRPQTGMFSELEVSREASRGRQTIDTLKRAIARHARLAAERGGKQLTEPPKRLVDLVGIDEATQLMASEDRAWQLRASTFHQALDAHKRAAVLAKSEMTALNQRVVLDERKVELANREFADLKRLEAKGLARRQRLLESQRLIADLEGAMRDVTAQLARAERTLSDAERDAGMLGHDFATRLDQEIRQLEEQIASGELALRATQNAIGQIGAANGDKSGTGEAAVSYQLVRRIGENQELIDVSETTQVQPGDVLRVSRRPD